MIPRLIYVASGDVSVYESQVLELLDYYKRCNIEVFLLQGYADEAEKNTIIKKVAKYSIPVVWAKKCPIYSIYSKQVIHNFYNALIKIPDFDKSMIQIRSEYYGWIFKKLTEKYQLSLPFLVDIRGVVLEEIRFKLECHRGYRKLLLSLQERYMKQCYDYLFKQDDNPILISSVSEKINDYIREHYPQCKYQLSSHPNISGNQFEYSLEKREAVRKEYGIASDEVLVVCATGGNSLWQQDFHVIQRLLDLGIRVINLSRKDYGIKGCITTTVPFSKMPDMLSAADAAVLWREDTFINQSASPSKFSEFASMGLYVIHNGSVKVATDYIHKTRIGCIVKSVDDISEEIITDIKQINRMEAYRQGRKAFGVENVGMSYLDCMGIMEYNIT